MWNLVPILTVFTLGLISPGPDFSIVLKNSLSGGRREGLLTTLGIVCGLLFHLSYCIFGLKALLQIFSSIVVWIRILGGFYLVYLGYKSFSAPLTAGEVSKSDPSTKRSWFVEGLLTNVLNPKAAMFFISIYSAVLLNHSVYVAGVLGLMMMSLALTWFSLVSYLCSTGTMTRKFYLHEKLFNQTLGFVLVLFGLSILILH